MGNIMKTFAPLYFFFCFLASFIKGNREKCSLLNPSYGPVCLSKEEKLIVNRGVLLEILLKDGLLCGSYRCSSVMYTDKLLSHLVSGISKFATTVTSICFFVLMAKPLSL